MKKHNPKIFLSYSYNDKQKANIIAEALSSAGLDVHYDKYAINHGNNLTSVLYDTINSSDYFIILLSDETIKSKWVLYELNEILFRELYYRDIVIIPVLLSRCKLPESLKSRKKFNLNTDFQKGLDSLVSYLKNSPIVDFKVLNAMLFEELIKDLLKKLNFNIVEYPNNSLSSGHDIIATHSHKGPFGVVIKTNWLFQLRFYSNLRADINSLRQFSFYLRDSIENFQGVLITNSQLTSAAREWLNDYKKMERSSIKIIDGVELKELLLKYPDLITKYFSTMEGFYE